jgi:hypothetical protein
LEEAKEQVLLQLQGAKDEIAIGVDDLNQLAYELRQTKSAHNLDSWRLGKLEAHNEQLKKQLTKAFTLSLFLVFLYVIICFFMRSFFLYKESNSGKNK